MRFRLTLSRTSKANLPGRQAGLLPINYQYFLSSWLYKTIQKADDDYSAFLHSKGYGSALGKQFKFFCFSPLHIQPFKLLREEGLIVISGETVELEVRFLVDPAAENFIKGLFLDQHVCIGNDKNRVDFTISLVESLPKTFFSTSSAITYQALSPVCLSKRIASSPYPQYLSPEEEGYDDLFIANLVMKYKVQQTELHGGLVPDSSNSDLRFRLLDIPKRKAWTIKEGTPQQSRVIGYQYRFELQAPEELHEIGYYAGFGEKNSLGFGFGEVVG